MFHGTADQDELTAKRYTLVRAAEIGKRNGFAYFKINGGKEREKNEKETIHETDARGYRDDPYLAPYPSHGLPRRRTETHTVTRTITKPVVKITVVYQNEECPDCLSVDGKLQEGVAAGILKN